MLGSFQLFYQSLVALAVSFTKDASMGIVSNFGAQRHLSEI